MSKRVHIWAQIKNGKIIETHINNELQGVLYANGEKGTEQSVWIIHHTPIDKKGNGKDALRIPYEERHNEKVKGGITTKTENKTLEIPLAYHLEVKSIGNKQYIIRKTGKMIGQRIPHIVNGKESAEANWPYLTPEQRKHLERIDVWEAYDELIKALEKGTTGWYVGALQQIYNRNNPWQYYKLVPETIKVPTHKLVNANITLEITAGKWKKTLEIHELGWEDCKGQIVRMKGFVLPREEIFRKNFPEEFEKYKVINANERR